MLNEMKSAFGENTAKKLAVGLAGALTLGTLLAGVVFATTNEPHQIKLDPQTDVNPVGEDHTVTATVTHLSGFPMPGILVSFQVVSGPNAGEVSDPGECSIDPNCRTDGAGQTSWTYPGLGGVGTDTIVACVEHEDNNNSGDLRTCAEARKEWVELACTETVNPHGKTTPPAGSTTLPGSKGGQNEDGFYELSLDGFPRGSRLWVTDASGSGPFGPFSPGDKVKITEAPGATPSSKPMGSSNGQAAALAAHITLTGDALLFAVDPAGNRFGPVSCLVPPPPK